MKMKKKIMQALDQRRTLIADFVGMILLVSITHCFKYVSAEEELSSFIFNVWKAGWRQKNIDKSHPTTLASTGGSSNAKYASLPYLMSLEITIEIIL